MQLTQWSATTSAMNGSLILHRTFFEHALVGHAAFKLLSSMQSSSLASHIAIVIYLRRDPLGLYRYPVNRGHYHNVCWVNQSSDHLYRCPYHTTHYQAGHTEAERVPVDEGVLVRV